MKKISIFSLFIFATQLALANETVTPVKGESGMLDWALHHILFLAGGAVIIGAFGALVNLFNQLIEVQKIRALEAQGIDVEALAAELVKKPSWWSKFYKNLTKAVPISKEKDVLLDHDYDGIKELDNVLPPWWVATFYATILIGVVYMGYWHFSDYGYGMAEEYEMNMKMAKKQVKEYLASQANRVDETNVELLTDESAMMIGSTIFKTKCTSCHGQFGEGNSIGPNLTDKYWLHGGNIKDVFKTIKYGIPEKGMISWKAQLRPAEIQKVASFVLSLKGSNPPNAKDPQGELYVTTEETQTIGMK